MPQYILKLYNKQKQMDINAFYQKRQLNYKLQINNRFLKVNQKFIKNSPLLKRKLQSEHNINDSDGSFQIVIHFNESNIKYQTLEKVFNLFENGQIVIKRTKQIINILQMVKLLELSQLFQLILEDLKINLEQYGFFTVFAVSQKFELEQLRKKCINELIEEDFEQVNFNRYDLISCQYEIFNKVMRLQRKQASLNKCRKLPQQIIREIVKQYSQLYSICIDPVQFLNQQLYSIIEQENQVDQVDKQIEFSKYQLNNSEIQTGTPFSTDQRQENGDFQYMASKKNMSFLLQNI